jgi:hypothetical protein
MMHVYSDNGKDTATGLPVYCRGTYQTLSGSIYQFGTSNKVWSYGLISAGTASSVAWSGITGKPNLVTLDTTQTITGTKKFTSGAFSLYVAGNDKNDSWFTFTDDGTSVYSFGIRRPYASYGF